MLLNVYVHLLLYEYGDLPTLLWNTYLFYSAFYDERINVLNPYCVYLIYYGIFMIVRISQWRYSFVYN